MLQDKNSNDSIQELITRGRQIVILSRLILQVGGPFGSALVSAKRRAVAGQGRLESTALLLERKYDVLGNLLVNELWQLRRITGIYSATPLQQCGGHLLFG